MYGFVITEKGLELDAKLRAGEQLKLTRVMVGDGTVPEGINPRKLTDLISPFAEATSTEPVAVGASTMLVVEYRNDMNDGLDRDRYINEYGLFAQDPDVGEILYLYCNLGDFREPVRAYRANEPVVTRRYPTSITVADGVDVVLGYLPSVFVLKEEALALIEAHSADLEAHQDLRRELSDLQAALNATAGGFAAKITFQEGCAGWNYRITDGVDETYEGTVPDSLTVTVVLRKCSTEYTVTVWDDQGHIWSNRFTTGEYFGSVEAEVTDFDATLTVTTVPNAKVTAICGNQSYAAVAGEEGAAELKIAVAGRYAVTAALGGKMARDYVTVGGSQSYSISLLDFRVDFNACPLSRGYIVFEPEDWVGNELRISQEAHGLEPALDNCVCSVRMRLGRNVRELTEDDVETVAQVIVDAMEEALDANKEAEAESEAETEPGSVEYPYPPAGDGFVYLTWEQVQYLLLENRLISASEAEHKAAELGFGRWKERDNGVETETTLEELMKAAYLSVLGVPQVNYDELCSLKTFQGLRFRMEAGGPRYITIDGQGYAAKYDMDGIMKPTWGTAGTETYMDTDTKELVLWASRPYPGDVLVIG